MKNKLAIVIPYYKIEFFKETLESLNAQTDKNFNLYIGNDKSPDDPVELIRKYQNIITKYIRFDTNLGGKHLAKQWERCIDALTESEEWVMLLCDDDTISENYVEKFYENLPFAESNAISLIKYRCKVIDEQNNILKESIVYPKIQKSTDFFDNLFYNIGFSSLSENIFRKEKYQKYGFQDVELAYGSDAIAVLEFSEFQNILFVNDAFMYFRDSEFNISSNRNKTDLRLRKMRGNTQYMTYLLRKYSNKFEYNAKVNMCKKLYACFRVVYRTNFIKNMYYFTVLFRNLKFRDFLRMCFTKGKFYQSR